MSRITTGNMGLMMAAVLATSLVEPPAFDVRYPTRERDPNEPIFRAGKKYHPSYTQRPADPLKKKKRKAQKRARLITRSRHNG